MRITTLHAMLAPGSTPRLASSFADTEDIVFSATAVSRRQATGRSAS